MFPRASFTLVSLAVCLYFLSPFPSLSPKLLHKDTWLQLFSTKTSHLPIPTSQSTADTWSFSHLLGHLMHNKIEWSLQMGFTIGKDKPKTQSQLKLLPKCTVLTYHEEVPRLFLLLYICLSLLGTMAHHLCEGLCPPPPLPRTRHLLCYQDPAWGRVKEPKQTSLAITWPEPKSSFQHRAPNVSSSEQDFGRTFAQPIEMFPFVCVLVPEDKCILTLS